MSNLYPLEKIEYVPYMYVCTHFAFKIGGNQLYPQESFSIIQKNLNYSIYVIFKIPLFSASSLTEANRLYSGDFKKFNIPSFKTGPLSE